MRRSRFRGFVALLTTTVLSGALWLAPPGSPLAAAAQGQELEPVKGLFLVARRGLPDPNFRRSVVFLLRHNENGTLGVIVNRQTTVGIAEAIPQVEGVAGKPHRLSLGGPVSTDRVSFLVRDAQPVDLGEHVIDDVYFGIDRLLLERLLEAGKPESELKVFAGYAGWGAGQLAKELARGDWRLAMADPGVIFCGGGESVWKTLIDRYDPLGIWVLADPSSGSCPVEPHPIDNERPG